MYDYYHVFSFYSAMCYILGSIPVYNAEFGEGSGSILLDNLVCRGNEGSLLNCASNVTIGNSNCQHSEDAGVRCEGKMKTINYLSILQKIYYIYHL